jgi:hypothetical protein
MPTRMLEHVSVWIDELGRSAVASFPHALEWALHLGLPLRIVVTTARRSCGRNRDMEHSEPPVDSIGWTATDGLSLTDAMRTWSAACTNMGIVLETQLWLGGSDVAVAPLLRPNGLGVLAEDQYERICKEIFPRGGQSLAGPFLICSRGEAPVRRLAVLHEHMNPNAAYLETAVHLCQALRVRPLVVTTACTARDAGLKRSYAEGVCASLGLAADFDTVFGPDPFGELRQLLNRRQCSHVVVEHTATAASRLPLCSDWLAAWRRLADTLSLVAVPEAPVLKVPQRSGHTSTAVARG